ncbi:LacI family DNA-binding transcriptional regulator [Ruficoccus sp. ZRK36]|uniref:LacI family DNA-binding transcriptional regulator n=1 Tax=Ruficoccus sp. ZRK36 TaxID=2866311 RepID=UPI001C738376|nr:LacI family DNA-binding transcriptional regulator [Ruficoccus sp. ZRK36]QYY36695.1 LacI family transcriptional regulator [Ruficoccus sp. ZRK36]
MQQATSMKHLAKIANCSVMTVSLALRNSHKVSTETRKRIQELAAEHGYRRNPMVSALMATRRGPRAQTREGIALLTKFGEKLESWREPHIFYSDLYNGMVARCSELGFALQEFPTVGPDGLGSVALRRILRARNIRGVILMPGGDLERPFPTLDYENHCLVSVAYHSPELNIHRSAWDYSSGMAECLEQVVARGYQRVGLALNKRLDPETLYAFSGRFFAWQQSQPHNRRLPLVSGREKLLDKEKFLAWYHRWRPDCIVASIIDYKNWLHEVGISVPEECGYAMLSTRGLKNVSGIYSPPEQMGRAAVNLVVRELFINNMGLPLYPETVLLKGQWVDGHSLRHPTGN